MKRWSPRQLKKKKNLIAQVRKWPGKQEGLRLKVEKSRDTPPPGRVGKERQEE
jgi:hypothetical protein